MTFRYRILASVLGTLVLAILVYTHKGKSFEYGEQPLPLSLLQAPTSMPTGILPAVREVVTLEASKVCHDFYAFACQRRGAVRDPTGTVQPDVRGEVEALRLYEQIIHEHGDWTSEQVDEELVRQIYTDRRRKRLLEVFQWVKGAMERFIENQPPTRFDPSLKRNLIGRIHSTTLEVPPPVSIYASEPDLFTKNDVYYETLSEDRRVIRIGGAYLLTAKSWFNRVFTFAHELAHSIDPCELQMSKMSPVPAYEQLLNCMVRVGSYQPVKAEEHCGSKDHAKELFADWVATQITAEALEEARVKLPSRHDRENSAINAIRDLCDEDLDLDNSSHPAARVRVGKVFGGSAAIQEFLECPKQWENSCEW